MKALLIIFTLIITSNSFGQDYIDTIRFKSGMERQTIIIKDTEKSVTYYYKGENGKSRKAIARKSMINSISVGNKRLDVASNFESTNPRSTEPSVNGPNSTNQNNNKSNNGKTAFATGSTIIIVAVLGFGTAIITGVISLFR